MRKLLMTTALALVMTGGVQAAETKDASASMQRMTGDYMHDAGESTLATRLIGSSVYASEGSDELLGDINNFVVADDGTIEAVVIGVGGFLGVGEKNVAVNFDSIRWIEDENGNQYAVYEASKESLQEAPAFEVDETAMAPASGQTRQDEEVMQSVDSDTAADPMQAGTDTDMAAAPADQSADDGQVITGLAQPTRELIEVRAGSLNASDLIGAAVYAQDEENVGEVGDLRLSTEDEGIDAVIVDVGGFLGMGEKPVAIAFDSLIFKTDESGALYVYTEFTREQLESAPDYDEAAYDNERDAMRLTARQE